MRRSFTLLRFTCGCVGLLVTSSIAWAHALHAEAKLENGRVVVLAKYDDGTFADNVKVTLIDAAGAQQPKGRTDKDGRCYFAIPPVGKYEILVDGGVGHKTHVAMTITEEMLALPGDTVISEGPTLAERESSRWLKLGIGVVAIAGFFGLVWLLFRRKRSLAA
jgi:hypothetical protein